MFTAFTRTNAALKFSSTVNYVHNTEKFNSGLDGDSGSDIRPVLTQIAGLPEYDWPPLSIQLASS